MDREARRHDPTQPVPSGGRFDALVTARQRGRKLCFLDMSPLSEF